MGVMGSQYAFDRAHGCDRFVIHEWVWWGHDVRAVVTLYHGAVRTLVSWGHDKGAAVLWIMIR